MENIFTDPDAWYDHYESIENLDEQIAFYHETFDKIEDVAASGFDDALLEESFDIIDELVKSRRIDELETFVRAIKEKQSSFYEEHLDYFIKDLFHYFLHSGNDEKTKYYLDEFNANPDSDIDVFLSVNSLIALFGKDDWTIESTKKYLTTTHINTEYDIEDVEIKLAHNVLPVITQKYYELAQKTGTFDYENWCKESEFYNLYHSPEIKEITNKAFEIKHYKDAALLTPGEYFYDLQIQYLFARYMKEKLDMPFSASYPIAKFFYEYTLEYDTEYDSVLSIASLKQYFDDQIDFFDFYFFKNYVGVLGLVYFYDFLLEMDIIDEELHASALAISQELQAELLKGNSEAWHCNGFLNYWKKPKSYSDEQFEVILNHVKTSFAVPYEESATGSFFRFYTVNSSQRGSAFDFGFNPNRYGSSSGVGSNVTRKKPERKKKSKPKPKNKKKKKK